MLGPGGKPGNRYQKKKSSKDDPNVPTISTFHSLCVRILRRQIDKLGYPLKFAIYNRGDQESLARTILRELNVADKLLAPNQLLFWIGHWKCKSMNASQAEKASDSDVQHLAAVGYRRYQRQLKLSGAVDFDDLLLLTERLFKEHPDIRQGRSRSLRSCFGRRIPRHEYQPVSNRQRLGRASEFVCCRRR